MEQPSRAAAAAWILLALAWAWIVLGSGHLAWDSRWHWFPVVLVVASMLPASVALADPGQRGLALLVGALGFATLVGYPVFYLFFVFRAG